MRHDSSTDLAKSLTVSQEPSTDSSLRTSARRGIPEFSDLVLACSHHFLLTAIVGSSVVITLAWLAWQWVPPIYTAEGLVRVREQQSVVYSAQTSRSEDVVFFNSQAKLVRSPQVLAAALRDPSVKRFDALLPEADRVEWLSGCLRVKMESGAEVMRVSVQHRSPEMAKSLCDAVTRSYLAEIEQRLTVDYQTRASELAKAAKEADQKLDKLWDDLNRVAQSVGSDRAESLTIRDEMQLQSYRDFARQLQTAQLRGNQLHTKLVETQLASGMEVVDNTEAMESSIDRDPIVSKLNRELLKLDYQIAGMRKISVSEQSPQIQRLIDQRELASGELARARSRAKAALAESEKTQNQSSRLDSVAQLKQEIEINRSEKEFLRERLSEMEPIVARSATKTAVPLDMSRHAVERQSRLADSLWQSLQELEIESQSQPRIQLIQLAKLPATANHSKQIKMSAMMGLGGGMLIVFIVGYVEWRDCRVRSADELLARSQFPLFGSASYSALNTRSLLGLNAQQRGAGINEAAATIFRRIEEPNSATPAILLSSPVMREARHLVSEQLSIALSHFQRRVLLIDCDSSSGSLSDKLEAGSLPGIIQLSQMQLAATRRDRKSATRSTGSEESLPWSESVLELIVSTDDANVDLLPLGQGESGSTWIDTRTLQSVIETTRPLYDTIIVNGPNAMDSANYQLLASVVDATVFAVTVNQSRWSELMHCEQSACRSGLAIAGTILHTGRVMKDQTLRVIPSQSEPFIGNSKEAQLRSEIEALQQEMQRVQAAHQAGSHDSQPHQKFPTTSHRDTTTAT